MPERSVAAIAQLKARFGDRISTARSVLDQHGRDEFWHAAAPPDAVFYPGTTDEVAVAVSICNETSTPVIPFGTGTSVEGHVQAVHGGISIDMTEMSKMIAVYPEDFCCVVEAGITRKSVNNALRDRGLFFPIDPGADASIGGMTATRASGTNAVRYGTMKDNVLAVKVVLPDGQIITTAKRAMKSSAGLDLTRLFVGSEGILGVITEVTLRLHGIPESFVAAVVSFDLVSDAVNTVVECIQSGIPLARAELLDPIQIDAINRYSGSGLPVGPTLFMEFSGAPESVKEQVVNAQQVIGGRGGKEQLRAIRDEDRAKLWQMRHDCAAAMKAYRPGAELFATDCCVPLSRLTECIEDTMKEIAQCPFPVPLLGHVGDGNYHLMFVIDPKNPDEARQAQAINERMVERAIAAGGTCTGEHGIGIGKKHFLEAELGPAVSVMAAIKRSLDPNNIMNPGKMLNL